MPEMSVWGGQENLLSQIFSPTQHPALPRQCMDGGYQPLCYTRTWPWPSSQSPATIISPSQSSALSCWGLPAVYIHLSIPQSSYRMAAAHGTSHTISRTYLPYPVLFHQRFTVRRAKLMGVAWPLAILGRSQVPMVFPWPPLISFLAVYVRRVFTPWNKRIQRRFGAVFTRFNPDKTPSGDYMAISCHPQVASFITPTTAFSKTPFYDANTPLVIMCLRPWSTLGLTIKVTTI